MKTLVTLLAAAALIGGASSAIAGGRQATTAAQDNALNWKVVRSSAPNGAYAQVPASFRNEPNQNAIDFQAQGRN
jgi:hypothetical protein